ncbi:MAG: hypothetical protein AAGB12_08115 [Pseudomonadota bacterium]
MISFYRQVVFLSFVIFSVSCGQEQDISESSETIKESGAVTKPITSNPSIEILTINTNKGTLGPLFFGMKEEQLKTLGLNYKKEIKNSSVGSGGETFFHIDLSQHIRVTARIDINNSGFNYLESQSHLVRDLKGLGSGSSLSSIKSAYPKGNFMYCDDVSGKTATYMTSQGVSFTFKTTDVEEHCKLCDDSCLPPDFIQSTHIIAHSTSNFVH